MGKKENLEQGIELINHKLAQNEEVKKAMINSLDECYTESRKLNTKKLELIDELNKIKEHTPELQSEPHDLTDK